MKKQILALMVSAVLLAMNPAYGMDGDEDGRTFPTRAGNQENKADEENKAYNKAIELEQYRLTLCRRFIKEKTNETDEESLRIRLKFLEEFYSVQSKFQYSLRKSPGRGLLPLEVNGEYSTPLSESSKLLQQIKGETENIKKLLNRDGFDMDPAFAGTKDGDPNLNKDDAPKGVSRQTPTRVDTEEANDPLILSLRNQFSNIKPDATWPRPRNPRNDLQLYAKFRYPDLPERLSTPFHVSTSITGDQSENPPQAKRGRSGILWAVGIDSINTWSTSDKPFVSRLNPVELENSPAPLKPKKRINAFIKPIFEPGYDFCNLSFHNTVDPEKSEDVKENVTWPLWVNPDDID